MKRVKVEALLQCFECFPSRTSSGDWDQHEELEGWHLGIWVKTVLKQSVQRDLHLSLFKNVCAQGGDCAVI